MNEREQIRVFNCWAGDIIEQTVSKKATLDAVSNSMLLFEYLCTELQNQLGLKLGEHKKSIEYLKILFRKCFESAIAVISNKIINYDLVKELQSKMNKSEAELKN